MLQIGTEIGIGVYLLLQESTFILIRDTIYCLTNNCLMNLPRTSEESQTLFQIFANEYPRIIIGAQERSIDDVWPVIVFNCDNIVFVIIVIIPRTNRIRHITKTIQYSNIKRALGKEAFEGKDGDFSS